MNKPERYMLKVLFLVTLALVLVGCGADVDMTVDFYSGENWETIMVISMPAEALTMAGGPGELEKVLNDMVTEAEASDIRAKWKETRSESNLVAYTVEMKGTGWDTLAQSVFDGEASISVDESTGRRLIYFSYFVSSGLGLNSQTITLRGGEIIAGNGRRIDERTMTWQNPSGRIEATLTERSRFNFGILLGGIAVVGLAIGGKQWWQRSQKLQAVPCSWCGGWIPEGARFCPECGRSR